ncbi:MAG: RICIN domain-containing protein [Oscillospiraceae bacterium]|nr:RICIN domain-containing protein [Oscillospiraceae bacterium]
MKNKLHRNIAHRGMSLLLAALMVAPFGVFAPAAEAAEATPGSTTTKIVVWDWIDDMQALGEQVDYDISNETSYIPIEETKYSRIMFYQNTMGDRYYFNASPDGGSKRGDWYTTYVANKIYCDTLSRVGDSAHKDWRDDMEDAEKAAESAGTKIGYFDNFWSVSGYMSISQIDAQNAQSQREANLEDAKSFITVGGERTPYIQWAEVKEGYNAWRLWAANKDDTCSDYAICLEDDYEDLNVRRTRGGFANPISGYGAKDNDMRTDPWIIDKHFRGAAAANYEYTHDNFVIWHWDNDRGGYNETMDFDNSGRRFKVFNAGTKAGVEEFKIFLGKEYKIPTLNENFEVRDDQITTLGRPLYYIPEGYSITVKKDGVLTVDGVLLNDGKIIVEDGGLLIVKDGAKIMPLTKYDKNCGNIYSEGSIVIEENALLCGGALNGVVIKGGGVINFGIIATENLIIDTSHAVDNRESGYIIAGKSVSRAARIRMIKDAIANEGETDPMDKDTDFAKLVGGDTATQIRDDSIYNHTENVTIDNTRLEGSASNPMISVYTRSTPSDTETPLFEDADLDNVSLRMEGSTAIYTVTKGGKTEEHKIQNKLVSALIARGATEKEKLFDNLWVGPLNGAYVQFEPACATGMRLGLSNQGKKDGDKAIIMTADSNKDKWWQIVDAGVVGENQTYYINGVNSAGEDRGLDVPGVNNVTSGKNVEFYNHSDGGNDQRWILERDSGNMYFIRNAANPSVSLAVAGGSTAHGTAVNVTTNDAADDAQRWTITLFSEDGYSDALDLGTAVEFIPGRTAAMRMALPAGAKTGQGVSIRTSDPTGNAQRWRLEPAGTDTLDGVSTTYYRIVELNTGLALTVQGNSFAQNADVIAETPGNNNMQYWYLLGPQDGDRYYIAARGNTSFVVSAPNSDNPSSGAALKLNTRTDGAYQQWQVSGLAGSVTSLTGDDSLSGRTFTMEPKHAPGMAARVHNAKVESGANVELAAASDHSSVQWTFTKVGEEDLDGVTTPYYTIENMNSSLVMDVYGDNKSGASVMQWPLVADDADKQWFAVRDADGYFTFVNRGNKNLCLDVSGAGTTAGTNIQVYTKNNTDAQKWKLTEVAVADRFDGKVFTLSPAHATDKNLDLAGNGKSSGTKVQLYTAEETEVQRWRFEKQGETYLNGKKINYYTIESIHAPGMVLDNSGSTANGARPHLWEKNVSNQNQLWFVESAGGGYYYIIPRSDTTKYLGVAGSSTSNNAAVELWDSNGDNRKWKFTETIAPETLGTYSILPKHAPGMHVGPASSDSNNGTKLIIWEYNESSNYARWNFVKMGTDSGGAYYKIVNMANGKVIDATGKNTIQADSQLQQWDSDFNNDQLWYLNDAGQDENGLQYYNIVNRCDTNYCMSVSGGSTTHGTGVTVSKKNGGDSQKFRLMERFEPVTIGTYEFGSAAAPSMRMDVSGNSTGNNANIQLYHRADRSAVYNVQKWRIVQRGNDVIDGVKTPYYSIENVNSGKTIDIGGAAEDAVKNNADLQTYDYDGYSDQHWYIDAQDDGTVIFRNRGGRDYVLEASGTTDNSKVRVAKLAKNASPAQRWQLHPVMEMNDAGQYYIPGSQAAVDAGIPNADSVDLILDLVAIGRYVLIPKHGQNSDMRLTLKGGSNSNGTAVVASVNDGTSSQRWSITPVGVDFFDGRGRIYYKLVYADSASSGGDGKVVETSSYGPPVTKDMDVQIWDYDGGYDQLWYLEQAQTAEGDEPAYYLIGRGTFSGDKICLEVSGGAKLNNTAIQTRKVGAGKDYQLWILEPFD